MSTLTCDAQKLEEKTTEACPEMALVSSNVAGCVGGLSQRLFSSSEAEAADKVRLHSLLVVH